MNPPSKSSPKTMNPPSESSPKKDRSTKAKSAMTAGEREEKSRPVVWNKMFNEWLKWKNANPYSPNVARSYKGEGPVHLCLWAKRQRKELKNPTGLEPCKQERREKLVEAGFDFGKQIIGGFDDQRWNEMFELWSKWKNAKNIPQVPFTHKGDGPVKLGLWVKKQRTALRNPTGLEPYKLKRRSKLEEAGFDFNKQSFSKPPNDQTWSEMLNEWHKWKTTHPNSPNSVPRSYKGDGPVHFGKWVKKQRAALTNPTGLEPYKLERRNRLVVAGFHFNPPTGGAS